MKIEFVKISDLVLPCNCLHYMTRKVTGVYEKKYIRIYHPCGKCYRCRKSQAAQWAFRCNIEAEDMAVYNMKFTYADAKLPMHNGKPSLNRQQLQDAFKRLRYYLDKHHHFKVRFFANGEYSPENERPHYHAILFSPTRLEKLGKNGKQNLSWLNGEFNGGQRVKDGYLAKIWPHGIASINAYDDSKHNVGAMVGYMVNYMFTAKPATEYDSFNKPFRMMSRGLGDRFAERYPKVIRNCKKRGKYTYEVPTPKGPKEIAYPRYYRNKWMDSTEKYRAKLDFYKMCDDYLQFRMKQNSDENDKFYRQLKQLKSEERREELDNFRKRKIHKRD